MCGSSRDSQQPPFFRSFRMEHMIAHSVRGVYMGHCTKKDRRTKIHVLSYANLTKLYFTLRAALPSPSAGAQWRA